MGPYRMSEANIDLADRPALLREALRAFAAKTGLEVPSIPMPDLTAEAFNHMLFIHLAALAALRGKAITDQNELLVDSLRHERNYWRRVFEDEDVDTQYLDGFAQLVALLTLVGGTRSAAETRDVIGLTPRLRDAESLLKNQMFDLLRQLYGREGGVSGLQPDLLGERWVADSLAKDDELIDIVFKNPKNASERVRYAYTVLTRLARQDDQERQWLGRALERHFDQTVDDAMAVAMETGSPMPEMITSVLQTANRPGRQKLVNALRVKLPKDTVNLMELAIEVAEQHVEFLVNQGNKKSFKFKLNTKDAYDLLASRYESTGRFKEAVDARRKALKFAQALPNVNRTPNRHTLAQAYLNLAVICGKTCYFDEALRNGEQAESMLRT
jgi:tetratricopeptide (TPR) repeat protein